MSYEMRHSDRSDDYRIVFFNVVETMLKVNIVVRSPIKAKLRS
jgi:hypothetical protein